MTVRSHRGRVVALPDLVAGLREHAGGVFAYRAAVELVVDHGVFLGRHAFLDEFVRVMRDGIAYVRWGAAVKALNEHVVPCERPAFPGQQLSRSFTLRAEVSHSHHGLLVGFGTRGWSEACRNCRTPQCI